MPPGDPGYSPAKALREDTKARKKPRGTRASTAAAGVSCHAKKKGGGRCTLAAGWGTNHPGVGACKFHGGCTPNAIRSVIKGEAILMGAPKEINPLDALLWCIKITAGEVEWISVKLSELDEKEWYENTIIGKQFHMFARERRQRLQDLARFSQMAVSLGIAERAVALAEQYGDMLARLLKGMEEEMLQKLELTPRQESIWRKEWPQTLRRQLIVIEGGAPDLADGRKALPAATEEAA